MSDFQLPDDCRFSEEDEWARVDPDGIVVGITDYAQQQLGDIVFLELPQVGSALARGESFGVIESVKAVSDLYAPVSGRVIAVNEALEDQPQLVNEDCYGEGWLIAVAEAAEGEIEELMDASAYRAQVSERDD